MKRFEATFRFLSTGAGMRMTILVLGVVALLAWHKELKMRFVARHWGVVEPGTIFRSGQLSQWLIEPMLTRHDIAAIIDLQALDPNDVHQVTELETARRHGIEHHRLPLLGDGTGDIRRYADALEILAQCRQQGKPVLVHCTAGACRTGGVVLAYRVFVQQKSMETASRELLNYGCRRKAVALIRRYLEENEAALRTLLTERGVLDDNPAAENASTLLAN